MFVQSATGRVDLTPGARRVGVVLLLLLTFGLLLPLYATHFIGDDYVQLWRIRDLLAAPSSAWRVFGPTWTDWYYRPVQHLWFLGGRLAFGYNPFGSYILQLDLHLFTAALLYRLARRLRVSRAGALSATALFAINAAHHGTVDWIAAVAGVAALALTLCALLTLEQYLARGGWTWAAGCLLLTIAALATHESAVITPLLLLLFYLQQQPAARRPLATPLLVSGLLLLTGYVALQLWRPNVHLNAGDVLASGPGALLSGSRVGSFIAAVVQHWSAGWLSMGEVSNTTGWLLALAAGVLLGALLWRGGGAARLAALWTALQLGFVYAAVWSSEPSLFSGRHLYSAGAGACLLLGIGGMGFVNLLYEDKRERRAIPALLTGTLLLLLLAQIPGLRAGQTDWLNLAQRADARRSELLTILPGVNDNTQLYTARFLYTAAYFPATTAVWYRQPEIQGGSLDLLLRQVRITPDFYVFDENDDGLYLLMPELQEHEETLLLLAQPAAGAAENDGHAIAGPAGQHRLALPQESSADRWTATHTTAGVTAGSTLTFGLWGDPGLTYRVRIDDSVVWEGTRRAGRSAGWQWTDVDLAPWWNQEVTLTFETRGAGAAYWANPRLVRGGVP